MTTPNHKTLTITELLAARAQDRPGEMSREAYDVFKVIREANYTFPIVLDLPALILDITTPEERAEVITAYESQGANWQPLTLSDVINSAGQIQLTEAQINDFVAVFGERCRQRTKDALRRMIRYPSTLTNYGIYSRVSFGETGCHYCAGQSYPDEVRTVRELILNR